MLEVTDENFDELFPKVEKALKEATYISIDSEYSGLKSYDDSKESLFDTPQDRYNFLRENIEPYIIMQCGITAFRFCREQKKFFTETFIFYLLPRSIPVKNRLFLWQSSCIEFLCEHEFDFNKFAYLSLSYLDKEEKAELRDSVKNETLLRSIDKYISLAESEGVMRNISEISQWITKAKRYDVYEIEAKSKLVEYLLHKRIRKQYKNLWTKFGNAKVLVLKVEKDEREAFEEKEGADVLDDFLMNYYLGFTKVFNLIRSLKKPIIGHNLFTDLMFMYKQFIEPLPKKYSEFKKNVHEEFPNIYDTKHMCFDLQAIVKREDRWKTTGLGDMYKYFTVEKGRYLLLNSPVIQEPEGTCPETLSVHDAGWDSFFAGYIFMKMAHIYAVKKLGSGSEKRKLTYSELITAVKPFVNNVNVIRATVSHVRFDGPDPESTRPQWLYVKLGGEKSMQVSEVAECLARFGNVDVKFISENRVLLAVGNHGSARDILKHFRFNNEFSVVPYNPIIHSPVVRQCCAWIGAVTLGVLSAWIVHKKLVK